MFVEGKSFSYYVGLFPELPISELGRRPGMPEAGRVGVLSLRLIDTSGEVIFDCRTYLDEMYWEWRRKEPLGYINQPFAPDVESSIFFPERVDTSDRAAAVLEVVYEPESDAPDIAARIRVTAGGFS